MTETHKVLTEDLDDDRSIGAGRLQTATGSETVYRGCVSYAGSSDAISASGSLLVAFSGPGGTTKPFALPVERGLWSIKAPQSATLALYRADLEGTLAWPREHEVDLLLNGLTRITLELRPSVYVIDGETRQALKSICAVILPPLHGLHKGTLPHIGSLGDTFDCDSRESPLPVDTLQVPGTVLFTAEGYTWGTLCLGRNPISSLVELRPAGTLRVVITDGREHLSTACWLRLSTSEPASDPEFSYMVPLVDTVAEHVLRRVREGDYRVDVISDPGSSIERSLFSGDGRIVRGAETTVLVSLVDPARALQATHVSFLVLGDDTLVSAVTGLSVKPVRVLATREIGREVLTSPADVVSTRGGVLEFRPLDLYPGSYIVETKPLGHVDFVSVPQDELTIKEISLAPCEEYTVALMDERDRRPLDLEWGLVATVSGPSPELRQLPPGGMSLKSHDGLIVFKAERSLLRLCLSVPGYGTRYFLLDGSKQTRFELTFGAEAEVRLMLSARGGALLAPQHWWTGLDLYDESGEKQRCYMEFGSAAVREWYSEIVLKPEVPGSFVLSVPSLSGSGRTKLPLEISAGKSKTVLDADSMSWQ